MTKNKIQQRNERSQNLRVLQVESDRFYVESSEGKICYRVFLDEDSVGCTCGDFSRNAKTDPDFKCKHILAVYNATENGDTEAANILKKKMPRLNDRFIMTLEGKDFVKYPGLLDLGHQKGISTIDVSIVQLPHPDNNNFAVCKATVVAKNGDTFIDIGDASPNNCNSKVARHLLRMASTRAIARALRSYTNIGMTCLEELGDIEEVVGESESKNKKGSPKTVNQPKKAQSLTSVKTDTPAQPEKTYDIPEHKPEKQENGKAEKPAKQDKSTDKKPAQAKTKKSQNSANAKEANNNQAAGSDNQKSVAEAREPMSSAQKSAIYNLSRRRSISQDELEKIAEETYGVNVDHLSRQEASSFIRHLQQAA